MRVVAIGGNPMLYFGKPVQKVMVLAMAICLFCAAPMAYPRASEPTIQEAIEFVSGYLRSQSATHSVWPIVRFDLIENNKIIVECTSTPYVSYGYEFRGEYTFKLNELYTDVALLDGTMSIKCYKSGCISHNRTSRRCDVGGGNCDEYFFNQTDIIFSSLDFEIPGDNKIAHRIKKAFQYAIEKSGGKKPAF